MKSRLICGGDARPVEASVAIHFRDESCFQVSLLTHRIIGGVDRRDYQRNRDTSSLSR